MVELLVHKERHVELVRHQAAADMARERGVAFDWRQAARAAAFVRHTVFVINTQREGRVVVEEKSGYVVVEDIDQRIRFFLVEPALQRLEAFENRCPRRIMLFMMIDCEADGRGMRDGNTANNSSHNGTPLIDDGQRLVAPHRPPYAHSARRYADSYGAAEYRLPRGRPAAPAPGKLTSAPAPPA